MIEFMPIRCRLISLVAGAALAASCGGTRPEPTLADYSHGASSVVRDLGRLFTNGSRPQQAGLTRVGAAGALEEVAGRWIAARGSGDTELRIVGFRLEKSDRATL